MRFQKLAGSYLIFFTVGTFALNGQQHVFSLGAGYSWGLDKKEIIKGYNRYDVAGTNGWVTEWRYVKPKFAEGVNIAFSYEFLTRYRLGIWVNGMYALSSSFETRIIDGQLFDTDYGNGIRENHFRTTNIVFRGGVSYELIKADNFNSRKFYRKLSLSIKGGISVNVPRIHVSVTSPPEASMNVEYEANTWGKGVGINGSATLSFNINRHWGVFIQPGIERLWYDALGLNYESKSVNGFDELNPAPGHPLPAEPREQTFFEPLQLPFHNFYIMIGVSYRI